MGFLRTKHEVKDFFTGKVSHWLLNANTLQQGSIECVSLVESVEFLHVCLCKDPCTSLIRKYESYVYLVESDATRLPVFILIVAPHITHFLKNTAASCFASFNLFSMIDFVINQCTENFDLSPDFFIII